MNFFGKSKVNARDGSSPGRVVIDVDVEEQSTGSLGLEGHTLPTKAQACHQLENAIS